MPLHISHIDQTCHGYPLTKWYPKKHIYITWDILWVLLTLAVFNRNSSFLLYREIKIKTAFQYVMLILLTIIESLKVILINIIAVLMMSAKLETPSFLKITLVRNSVYNVIIKIFSCHSYCIKNLVMWLSLATLAFMWQKVL